MIAMLRGVLADKRGPEVVIDCGGVGYQVHVSGCTANALPAAGEVATLRIFTHAQENKIALFGFATEEERDLFDLLITVKNVGPSSAIKILSAGAGPHDIANLIASEKVAGLKSIKGVGKKTADLLIVELREKCESLLLAWGASRPTAAPAAPAARKGPLRDDVLGALVQLGWRPAEAEKAVESLELSPDLTLESALRQALRAMPR
jgi:holliday junction DNA helicase RuvA